MKHIYLNKALFEKKLVSLHTKTRQDEFVQYF